MSFHNHQLAYTDAALATFDRIGMEDETIARPFPRASPDPRVFFREWVTKVPNFSSLDFFDFEKSYWSERQRANLLLVHYNDLKSDLAGEMRRIAGFLDIRVPDSLWPELVGAADFDSMRRDGEQLMPRAGETFQGGASRFLFKGTNGRWTDVLNADDLAMYAAKVDACFPPACARWVEGGRHGGEPRST